MKTKAGLFRRYADIIEMCEGTRVKSWECVKYCGDVLSSSPIFNGRIEEYEIAHCLIGDEAVFTGSVLYFKDRGAVTVDDNGYFIFGRGIYALSNNLPSLSWGRPEPKQRIELHGSIPKPDGDFSGYELQSRRVFYKNIADRDEASRILISLMGGE